MKKILIYYPFNIQSVSTQAQVEVLVRLGYEVYLLTWAPKGDLHRQCEAAGAKVYSAYAGKDLTGFRFFSRHIRYLVNFTRQHKIERVISHLQGAGMVSGFAKFFRKLKVYYMRHNSDYFELRPSRKDKLINKLANKFPDRIIAISDKVKTQLLKEGVADNRIERVDLCYDFAKYGKTDQAEVDRIRQQYPADVLLLIAARLDPLKRHLLSFQAVEQLLKKNIDVKLICIGDGPERHNLSAYIKEKGLQENIFLAGYVTNVIDYFSASNLLLHLSYSEASSHVAKEAGSCRTTAVVCRDVGDFNDYLENNVNAFLVDKEHPLEETVAAIEKIAVQPELQKTMGQALYDTVYNRFSIDAVIESYQKLLRD